MSSKNTQPARGMRDFLPADIRKRNYVIGIIKEVYEKYGFEPLETPSVENLETLTGKYGEEGNQLMFKILKRGEKLQEELAEGKIKSENELSDLALRYDLTVPLARVVANYKNELPKFFKRYQIQPVWRADRPARGRYREFYQCDVDAIGSSSMIVETELCAAVSEILEKLGFDDFVIRINHREILRAILIAAGVSEEKHTDALVALDKIDKIGREGVAKELVQKGVSKESEVKLLSYFEFFVKDFSNQFFSEAEKLELLKIQKEYKQRSDSLDFYLSSVKEEEEKLKRERGIIKLDSDLVAEPILRNNITVNYLNKVVSKINTGIKAVNEIAEILSLLNANKIEYEHENLRPIFRIKVDPSLARGLSYYTGAIFEVNIPDFAGSIAGGGRYDGLIGMFGKEQIPAVGFSIGLERIIYVMEERGMFPEDLTTNSADVMVTIWNEDAAGESLKLASELRAEGLRVLVYPEADKLGKQFKYADSLGIPYVCVLGDAEIAENKVALKNLKSGEQETLLREELKAKIKG